MQLRSLAAPGRWRTCSRLRRLAAAATPGADVRRDAIDQAQAKMVKIYGAGGFRGLEAYQSGILISAQGHILTVFSHVLDTDYISVTLADGRKFEAKLLGADPRLDVAVLKIEANGLPHFDLRRRRRRRGRRPRAGPEQPLRRGHGQRAGQRAARHGFGRHAAGRPPRRRSRPPITARSTCWTW